MPNAVVLFSVSTVVSDEFDRTILSAKLFNLLDGSVFLQLSLCALFQLAHESFDRRHTKLSPIDRLALAWPDIRDDKWIVPQCLKEFTQHLWLFGVLCHAIHFSL